MDRVRVFLSSPVIDLEAERDLAEETLKNLGLDTFRNESATAQAQSPQDVCLSKISECDLFVLIVGGEYGHIPDADSTPGSPYDGKISVTHGEFLKARELRKPILVFVKDVPRNSQEESFLGSLDDFLDGQFYTKFKEKEELRERLLESIPDLLAKLIRHTYTPSWKEKINVMILKDHVEVAQRGAEILGLAIKKRSNANVGLFAGKTAGNIYYEFFRQFNAEELKNIAGTRFFSVTEHFGVGPKSPNSYNYWFHEAFFNKVQTHWNVTIKEDQIMLVPSIIEETLDSFKDRYDQHLQINKVDVQLMSPAPNGQFISIDPNTYSVDEMLQMGASLVRYSKDTSQYLVPKSPHDMDIVIGMKNLLSRSERLVIFAYGQDKRDVVRRMILGPIGNDCPASLVARYPKKDNLLYVIDEESSKGLPGELDRYINHMQIEQWEMS
jgi:6-phosphogluconolactonase/glucosamine-6-phosphate isomerase/deaminase